MLKNAILHHVSVPVSDIGKARRFYVDVLGLAEDPARPNFEFDGAWLKLADRSVHLIVPEATDHPTFRAEKAIDSHDAHFAIRVASFSGAIAHLESKGYRRADDRNPLPSAENPLPMRISAAGRAGFPQIYLLDPDRNVIEINAEKQD
jgi:catechol 2,3-dioxygenase-like lactoylglutathione lyase family enzyme